MAMGCHAIVAEGLTITGSIGVVAATFNLREVYRRIGFSKEVISRGRSVPACLLVHAPEAACYMLPITSMYAKGRRAAGVMLVISSLHICLHRHTWHLSLMYQSTGAVS